MNVSYEFAKGHGTENDFVLLPDPDGTVHGELSAERVRALCDRRAGIGGDGVIRVIRTAALVGIGGDLPTESLDSEWFMDYRNSDGSMSEMCGNGVRVMARYLQESGLLGADVVEPLSLGTRGGLKVVSFEGDLITVDMGEASVGKSSQVQVGETSWTARDIGMGNPHAVSFVEDLADAGDLRDEPHYDHEHYPEGVNIEFVVRPGVRHLAMRVHERGSGETRSCGTGACAVMVASALGDGSPNPPHEDVAYRVDVPGGELLVTWRPDNHVLLTGPAVVVARGRTGC